MKINVVKSVLDASDTLANVNRRRMDEAALLCVNLLSAPGSGKTTLLEKSLPLLGGGARSAVLVGDLQTTRDAERLADSAAQVTQINTGSGCHLSPSQVAEGLDGLDLAAIDYLFIENVGNMVCPAAFDLGEHRRAVLLSVPEGDDKVAKYPTLFQKADVILLTKVDLVGVLDYRFDRVTEDLAKINTAAPLIRCAPKDGTGLDEWLAWLREQREALGN
jgi:hydrogenase nickel incorporation protein HypB